MDEKNIIISIYTNASGFLWHLSKVDSGTYLGWCGFEKNYASKIFTTYENALEDALSLIEKCDLTKFAYEYPKKTFHWGHYAEWLNTNYRDNPKK